MGLGKGIPSLDEEKMYLLLSTFLFNAWKLILLGGGDILRIRLNYNCI